VATATNRLVSLKPTGVPVQSSVERNHFKALIYLNLVQGEESIQHLLISCVFSRQFWFRLFHGVGLHMLAPGLEETSFFGWWERITAKVDDDVRKGVNSLVILGAW
jgi:hypothetical protein